MVLPLRFHHIQLQRIDIPRSVSSISIAIQYHQKPGYQSQLLVDPSDNSTTNLSATATSPIN